jgi:hypothetical protein
MCERVALGFGWYTYDSRCFCACDCHLPKINNTIVWIPTSTGVFSNLCLHMHARVFMNKLRDIHCAYKEKSHVHVYIKTERESRTLYEGQQGFHSFGTAGRVHRACIRMFACLHVHVSV